jgi:hypothetical protein
MAITEVHLALDWRKLAEPDDEEDVDEGWHNNSWIYTGPGLSDEVIERVVASLAAAFRDP